MPIPIRIAVRVDFDDGSQHEYDVHSPGAAGMPELGQPIYPSAVTTPDTAERLRYHEEREAKLTSAETTLATLREWAQPQRDMCSAVIAEYPAAESQAGFLRAVKDVLTILDSRDLPPGAPVVF